MRWFPICACFMFSAARVFAVPRDVLPADGWTVAAAVASGLVERPVEASFDDRGRLYVTEVTGTNEPPEVQRAKAPHRLLRLEDTDGDGVFDHRVVFADRLGFPEGVLWHEGAVYVSVPPQILKFNDRDGDGAAEERTVWFDGKTLTGCANDLHGPYAGPDGLLYWCKGAFAEQTHDLPGQASWKSRAAHVFRMKPDGSACEVVFTAGMDNPVGLAWTPEGDLMVCGTFLQHPGDGRRDGIIHAVRGGLWGKDHDVLDGHYRTGPLLPPMTHLGPAAPAGLCRYGRDLLASQFNLRRVSRHELEPDGATWKSRDSDFLSSEDPDFHPTDVLQAPDGSVLVIDTGGWYKLCCPTSQVARPEATGHIYRLRKKDGEIPADCPPSRWNAAAVKAGAGNPVASPHPHIRRHALEKLAADPGTAPDRLAAAIRQAASADHIDRFSEHAIVHAASCLCDAELIRPMLSDANPVLIRTALWWFAQREPAGLAGAEVLPKLHDKDEGTRMAAVFGLRTQPAWRDAAGPWLETQIAGGEFRESLGPAVDAIVQATSSAPALARWLGMAKSPGWQLALLAAMESSAPAERELPEALAAAVLPLLDASPATSECAAAFLARGAPASLQPAIAAVAHDSARPAAVRLPLFAACRPPALGDEAFAFLLKSLADSEGMAEYAARTMAAARLTGPQRDRLLPEIPRASLLLRPVILKAFAGITDERSALALLHSLRDSGALATLPGGALDECFAAAPAAVRENLAAARKALSPDAGARRTRLDELEKSLPPGDPQRGKVVFQSAAASCALCHQAGYLGRPFGPDLSRIGSIRTLRDLLEAIAFPSASFVRSFEPIEIRKTDGSLVLGLLSGQNHTAITLATNPLTPALSIPRQQIASVAPAPASLMPQGIDRILSPAQLADLTAFLLSLR
jgi:putative heme-binding domain-containing protein